MAGWRVAKALEALRAQVNALAPNRSKASDGTIGDAAHAATKSDHNPDADGVVKALDLTHDPANGCDCNAIWNSLRDSRDPRIQYLIWNRQIVNADVSPWVVRPYNGSNPHSKHIHISVKGNRALYDDQRPWQVQVGDGVSVTVVRPAEPAPPKRTPPSPIPDVEPTPPRPAPPAITPTDALGGAVTVGAIGVGAWLWNALGWVGLAVIVCGVLAGAVTYANRKKRSS